MKCIILASGYATRLYPLTKDKPKSLISIAGKPILNYILDKLSNIDELDSVYIISNNQFYNQFVGYIKKTDYKKPIYVLNNNTNSNEERLGSIGDLNFALEKEKIDDDVLLIAGDTLSEFDFKDLIEFYNEKKNFTIVANDINDLDMAKNLGVLELENGKLIGFEEKPEKPKSTIVSCAIHILNKKNLDLIKDYVVKGNPTDLLGLLIQYLHKKIQIDCFVFKGAYFDIGTLSSLEEANEFYTKKSLS